MSYMMVQDADGMIITQVEIEDSFWSSFKDQIMHRVTNVYPEYTCTEITLAAMAGSKPDRIMNCMGDVGNWVASLGYE
jgi:hypothetical protein